MLGLTSWWAEEGRRLLKEGKRLCEFCADDDDDGNDDDDDDDDDYQRSVIIMTGKLLLRAEFDGESEELSAVFPCYCGKST